MKNVILTPNPYRDKGFQTVREAKRILEEAGINCKICLPFEVDHTFALPTDLHFYRLDREIHNCDLVICFGGDGTILHMAKSATKAGVPVLGINIGTMGFMAELESTELQQLSRLATNDFVIDSRLMLDVIVQRGQDIIFHDIALNDAVITKGAIARISHLSVKKFIDILRGHIEDFSQFILFQSSLFHILFNSQNNKCIGSYFLVIFKVIIILLHPTRIIPCNSRKDMFFKCHDLF